MSCGFKAQTKTTAIQTRKWRDDDEVTGVGATKQKISCEMLRLKFADQSEESMGAHSDPEKLLLYQWARSSRSKRRLAETSAQEIFDTEV